MGKMKGSMKLSRELIAFARQNRIYWIVPLVAALLLTGLVIFGGKAAAPLLYTLF